MINDKNTDYVSTLIKFCNRNSTIFSTTSWKILRILDNLTWQPEYMFRIKISILKAQQLVYKIINNKIKTPN